MNEINLALLILFVVIAAEKITILSLWSKTIKLEKKLTKYGIK